MNLNDFHAAIEITSAGIGFAGFIILLMIKTKQAEVKEELTRQITQTAQTVAVHAARDEEKFISIDDKLERIDAKLDHVNGR